MNQDFNIKEVEVIMNKHILIWIVTFGILALVGETVKSQDWSIKANIAEACNCNIVCPCVFGSSSTHDNCDATRLIEIEKGNYGNIVLDGLTVQVSFSMGEWSKFYISDKADEKQAIAAEKLISATFRNFADWGIRSVEQANLSVERNGNTITYTNPDSYVKIETLTGVDDKPIKIENLKNLKHYTQYISIENSHKSDVAEFSYSGTNALTARVEAEGSIN